MFLIKKGQMFQNFKITYRSSTLIFGYETYFTILLQRVFSHKMILPSGKTKVKPSQFRAKAAAASFIQQHMDAHCDPENIALNLCRERFRITLKVRKISTKCKDRSAL